MNTKLSIYKYNNYKEFLLDIMLMRPNKGRGERKIFAELLNCQSSFITHVLNGNKDFNQEQLYKIAKYFELSENEKEYLMLLLSYNRSGTAELQSYYEKILLEKRKESKQLKKRINSKDNFTIQDQAKFFSHWLYMAVHQACTIPHLQSLEKLTDYFQIPKNEIMKILQFLSSNELVSISEDKITSLRTNYFISSESPFLTQMHSIWRLKLLNEPKKEALDNIHYTWCFAVSKDDWDNRLN